MEEAASKQVPNHDTHSRDCVQSSAAPQALKRERSEGHEEVEAVVICAQESGSEG